MKIVKSAEQCKAEQIARSMDSLVAQLKTDIQSAATAGDSFDRIERLTLSRVLQMGRQALNLLLALQGDGDMGEEIETADGWMAQRTKATARTRLRSIFGEHMFEQVTYSRGKNKPICLRPISARVSLPESQWSNLLQEFSQMLGVDQAWDQALTNLGTILDSTFSVDTAERLNGNMGRSAGEFLGDLPIPEEGSEEKLLIATADCKGVPLVSSDRPKVAAFETARKNPGNRRIATVTSVYSVAPHVRTAEDIVASVFREEHEADRQKKQRPKPQNKNTTAHFPELADGGLDGDVPINGIHVGMA